MHLIPQEIDEFRDRGYLIFNRLLDRSTVERSMAQFKELVARSREMERPSEHWSLALDAEGRPISGRLHKIQGVCVVDERVLELARYPEILDRVESLIGPDIDVFGTKFFPMLGPNATSTGWHQDNHYFGTNSDRVVSCAVYLEAVDRESGCLQVAPYSHQTRELAQHAGGKGEWAHGNWTEVDESRAVDVVCGPGTVVLFSANLLHGAHPNLTARSSFRTAWHYVPADLNLELFPRGGYRDRHIVREST